MTDDALGSPRLRKCDVIYLVVTVSGFWEHPKLWFLRIEDLCDKTPLLSGPPRDPPVIFWLWVVRLIAHDSVVSGSTCVVWKR